MSSRNDIVILCDHGLAKLRGLRDRLAVELDATASARDALSARLQSVSAEIDTLDPDGYFIQKFRWLDTENSWIATKTGGDRVEYRSRPRPFRDEHDVANSILPGPPDFNLRCRWCAQYDFKMSGLRAQRTLTQLSIQGYRSPTREVLSYVYDLSRR